MSVRGGPAAAPALSALLVLALTAAPAAHPGAASDLVVEIARPGTVDVLLTTDPEALLLKLRALAPSDAGSAFVPAGVDRPLAKRIAPFQRVLVDHVSVTADDQPLALAWIALEDPEHPADRRAGKIVVRLRAAVPPDATALRVRTGLIFGTYALIVRGERRPETIAWLHGAEESAPIDLDDARREPLTPIVLNGLRLGFTHIVPSGLDHALFVLGLFLLTPRLRALVAQVSVFTLAHSATLAATALGMISPPGAIIEPLIALSIVFIAFENIIRSTVSRWRLWLIFCFGLLHGMGFAGALTALDLTRSHLLTTIVTFNVGVELAQIAVLAAAAVVVRASAIAPDPYRRFVVRPASLAIAAMGVIWLLDRVT